MLKPVMSAKELALFENVLQVTENYFEFGSGGSTCLASRLCRKRVISVDSSQEWLDKVRDSIDTQRQIVRPQLVHADIGPVGNWGVPVDESNKHIWSNYYNSLLGLETESERFIYFVDGRFRVACAMQILSVCHPDSVLMVHDYSNRDIYHSIGKVAHEIVRAETLSLFSVPANRNRAQIAEFLHTYGHNSN